ncbi:MAG: NAD(P)-dependent glycerol-3-phosphate dehydrogenase [Acidobacteria bacterium]|nr:NAD(P)-dependent glycerol-3-phosphate dehydrogenase [Acidobacteriota bacterium]MCB9398708.1 NAD(P)-dependent glycerol-3-phosphate dehydrogenase [Acidobacteriota bacterium]
MTADLGVIGGGSWGTAMAIVLAQKGLKVDLWVREADRAERMQTDRVNRKYLAKNPLPESIRVTHRLSDVFRNRTLLLAIPLQAYRAFLKENAHHLRDDHDLILLSKGMELGTHLLPTEIVVSVLGEAWRQRAFMLSGPSFAQEVADLKPTTIVLAGKQPKRMQVLQSLLMGPTFRIYNNSDVIGVELAGALKNVMAIASGIAWGKELGHNTMAGLITRGLAEIARLGAELGAERETFAGLAGMGDLILTCTGGLSRNLRVGMALAKNQSLDQILSDLGMVAEGVHTCRSAYEMGQARGVDLPITNVVYAILYEGITPDEGLYQLMTRSPKWENLG